MSKQILTVALLTAGVEAVAKSINPENAEALAAEIVALATAKKEAQEKAAKAEADLKDALALIDKHEAEIEKLSANAPAEEQAAEDKPTFKVGEITYGFEYPSMILDGVRITPDEICASEDLQKKLIERNSGMIKVL